MTEVSERLKKLIDQLENFENHETGDLDIDDVKQDLNYIYSLIQDDMKDHQPDLNIKNNNNDPTLWSQIMTDHHPAFAVGEYYYSNSYFVYKMLKVGNAMEPYEVRALDLGDGVMRECSWYEKEIEKDRPATAEQIATFKCAEIKREIGLIIKNGDADWIEIVEDIEEYLAEELQEVEDGESNKSS